MAVGIERITECLQVRHNIGNWSSNRLAKRDAHSEAAMVQRHCASAVGARSGAAVVGIQKHSAATGASHRVCLIRHVGAVARVDVDELDLHAPRGRARVQVREQLGPPSAVVKHEDLLALADYKVGRHEAQRTARIRRARNVGDIVDTNERIVEVGVGGKQRGARSLARLERGAVAVVGKGQVAPVAFVGQRAVIVAVDASRARKLAVKKELNRRGFVLLRDAVVVGDHQARSGRQPGRADVVEAAAPEEDGRSRLRLDVHIRQGHARSRARAVGGDVVIHVARARLRQRSHVSDASQLPNLNNCARPDAAHSHRHMTLTARPNRSAQKR